MPLTTALLDPKSLEEETNSLKQSLQGMLNSLRADDEALADFREVGDTHTHTYTRCLLRRRAICDKK